MKTATVSAGKKHLASVFVCDSFFSRLRGLMFRSSFPQQKGLLFVSAYTTADSLSIHSLFVSFSFDAIWLDRSFHVVDIVLSFRPFRLYYRPKKPAVYLLELPVGKARSLHIGQRLTVMFKS